MVLQLAICCVENNVYFVTHDWSKRDFKVTLIFGVNQVEKSNHRNQILHWNLRKKKLMMRRNFVYLNLFFSHHVLARVIFSFLSFLTWFKNFKEAKVCCGLNDLLIEEILHAYVCHKRRQRRTKQRKTCIEHIIYRSQTDKYKHRQNE